MQGFAMQHRNNLSLKLKNVVNLLKNHDLLSPVSTLMLNCLGTTGLSISFEVDVPTGKVGGRRPALSVAE